MPTIPAGTTGELYMTAFYITNPDQLRSAGKESKEDLWGKQELFRRKGVQKEPYFQGEYRFERKVADRVPDCIVLSEVVNRWFEFVTGFNQLYREKTREALRLGFVIHWVTTRSQ